MASSSAAAARRRAELCDRGAVLYAQVVALLGRVGESADDRDALDDLGTEPAAELRTLDGQLAILGGLMRERLRHPGAVPAAPEVAEISNALHEVHTVRFGIHDHLGHERLRRIDELDRGLAQLRRLTDQDALLEGVCASAALAGGFERVMLSRVDDQVWRPWRSWASSSGEAEQSFRDWIAEDPRIPLSRMLLESDLVRRREAALVQDAASDARVYAPLARAAVLSSYVAAPIVAGDRVIGLLHADNRGSELVELDRDVLWFFASGFAQIFERAVLLARLRDQRAEVMQAMKAVEAVLDELASTEIELATRAETTAVAAVRPVRPVQTERPAVLEQLLTSRELEVLALMATGATNERIAHRLVIATDTVKSHVKQVLRKLQVENRAEAISQYLRLTIGARED